MDDLSSSFTFYINTGKTKKENIILHAYAYTHFHKTFLQIIRFVIGLIYLFYRKIHRNNLLSVFILFLYFNSFQFIKVMTLLWDCKDLVFEFLSNLGRLNFHIFLNLHSMQNIATLRITKLYVPKNKYHIDVYVYCKNTDMKVKSSIKVKNKKSHFSKPRNPHNIFCLHLHSSFFKFRLLVNIHIGRPLFSQFFPLSTIFV